MLLPEAAGAGQWRLFVPRPVKNGASLDLFGSAETDEITETARPTRWSDDFLKARFTLFSEGYVYHPRFLIYRASVGPAIKREQYEDTGMPSVGWQQSSGLEYDFQLTLLPEHAYNLTVFARRIEPLARERSTMLMDAIDTSFGASVRYRRRPLFGSASYVDDTIETGDDRTRIRKIDLNGQYLKDFGDGRLISFTALFSPSRYDNNRGFSGDTSEASVGNVLERRGLRLSSTLSHSDFEQRDKRDGDYGATQLLWREQLTADLGHHLRGWLEYRYLDNESVQTHSTFDQRLESRSHQAEGAIVHRLFESLESAYTARYSRQNSTAGRSEMLSHELTENYTKRVPGGRLQMNLSLSTSLSDNRGRADVIREGHQAVAVPGSFPLVRSNVDEGTLAVYARSPIAPYEAILLAEGVHYSVQSVGATLEVRVLSLPPPFTVPGSYTFEATYSMLSGRFRLRTDSLSNSASIDLFSNHVTPFYSYMKVRSRVERGVVPGFLPDSTTWTVGLRSLFGPVRGRVQFQDVKWDGSPYTALEGELQYVGAVGRKASLYATLSYVRRDYQRTAEARAGRAYVEEIQSASANYQHHLFDRTLTLAAGAGYTRIRSLADTEGLTWNGSLAWNVGKLSVSAGASSYLSESVGLAFSAPRRLHRYYFVRINRRLY